MNVLVYIKSGGRSLKLFMKSTKTHPLISKFIIYYVAIECVVYLVGMREKEGLVKLLELKNCGLLYWKLK